MVLFPEVQEKAQAELDAIVGKERLPSLNDRDLLPYINAVCKEVLRWHSVTPLGTLSVPLPPQSMLTRLRKALAHVATEDIYAEGFLIPKGTYILGNVWYVPYYHTLCA